MTKKEMANKLGYEYLGKGIDSEGNDGFIVRKYGTAEYKSIGNTVGEAYDWLSDRIEDVL